MRETFLRRRFKIITYKIILEHFRIRGPRSVLGTLPLVRVFTDETPTRVFKFRFSGDRAIARKITSPEAPRGSRDITTDLKS